MDLELFYSVPEHGKELHGFSVQIIDSPDWDDEILIETALEAAHDDSLGFLEGIKDTDYPLKIQIYESLDGAPVASGCIEMDLEPSFYAIAADSTVTRSTD